MRIARKDLLRALDSYGSLLVLLLANFFLLELVDDPRWGAVGSTILAAAALIVAISDPDASSSDDENQFHGRMPQNMNTAYGCAIGLRLGMTTVKTNV